MKHLKIIIATALITGCIAIKPTTRIEFEAADSYPEGIAFDSTKNIYYVSSARLGTLGKVSPEGQYSVLYTDASLKSTYGLKIHPDGRHLIAAVGDANYSKFTSPDTRKKMGRLISIDLSTGTKAMDVDLSKLLPGKHFPNDIAFDQSGNMYVTDSYAHAIYKITPAGAASVFAKSKLFETEGIGLNGIIYHPDGFLIVDNTNTGMLYKVSLANPADVRKIQLDQFYTGADGMLLNNRNKLTVVVNGGTDKIYQLTTEDNWNSAKLAATTLIADRFTYPSTATINGGEVWVMNAKFSELPDSNSVPLKKFAIQHAVFKPVPH